MKRPGFMSEGYLHADGRSMRCALGRSGIGVKQGEGDGVTPIGRFRLLDGLFRSDRLGPLSCPLQFQTIKKNDGWCDETGDRNYNQPVTLPYSASHEALTRTDHLYDIVLILDFNISRRMTRGGSAIFFHLAHDDYRPTEGCVAISRHDMLWLLPRIDRHTEMVIG